MPKFVFKPEELRLALSLARVVKPETKDLSFTFSPNSLTVFSYDKRRYSCARITTDTGNANDDWISPEFHITLDRTALFESDLTSVSISVNDQSLTVSATDGDQIRKASLKRRSIKSRRPAVPRMPDIKFSEINASDLDLVLGQVACSAQIKETKTDEEMRVNQVHFYGEKNCACSSARYHGSIAYLDGLGLDLSIISSDIPIIRGFCTKISGDTVNIGQDRSRLYLMDPITKSFLAMSKMASTKPPFSTLDVSGFRTVLSADQGQLLKNLSWASLAIEGTQRIGFRALKADGQDSGDLELLHGSEEISRFPVKFLKGKELTADFPVRFLHSISKHVNGDVLFGFDHPDAPKILGVYGNDSGSVRATHYLMSMVSR